VIIADTSGLLAFFNRSEPEHDAVRQLVGRLTEPMVVSPYVIAELDYLVATRAGVEAELGVLRELGSGAYVLPGLDAGALSSLTEVIARYRDQDIGAADASLVLLADRYGTRDILTLDRRHFGVLRPLSGGRFKVLPGPSRA